MSTLQILFRILFALIILTIAVDFIDRASNWYVLAGCALVAFAIWPLYKPLKHFITNL